ncbi:hypothetical protein EDC14_1001186 [Hydrogenispora ethanolica]|uniref:PD-(D/E)XK nuclease domain-containing protein n=2 Tax=Hydrogenispora ethanolica TaxID=1082276 RepID=A0A4R1SBM0_HYDET|nr:hypothetical protein EDC14_1001186 [Hydrogenispora ethanolica]
MDRQGGLANSQGRTLEQVVIATLQQKGFQVLPYAKYQGTLLEGVADDLLLTNVPFENIYGQQSKTEFKLVSRRWGEYRIECKWQQSAGSVDEKFPYLYLNCIEKMPEANIILIVDGQGARPGAVEWLRRAARERLYQDGLRQPKNIQVFSMAEFVIWANKTFRG